MTSFDLKTENLKMVLKKVAAEVQIHADELRELDAKAGDGDLGVTIELACNAISDFADSTTEEDPGRLLAQLGLSINKTSPSTFGTILASAFMGGGKALIGKTTVDIEDLIAVGDGAIDNIKKRGKAEAGDKTMLDTLIPCIDALKTGIAAGTDMVSVIYSAIKAAEEGMKATVNMKAKFGRAQWFQDGALGIQDAGATATYYFIKAFSESVIQQ